MNTGIQNVFSLMTAIFDLIMGNPLLAMLVGIIVVSIVVGIVTAVFNSRRRSRSRR